MAGTYSVRPIDPRRYELPLEVFRSLLADLTPPPHRVSCSLLTNDFETAAAIATSVHRDVSCFLWKEFSAHEFTSCNLLERSEAARVQCGRLEFSMTRHWETPDYDWSETKADKYSFSFRRSLPTTMARQLDLTDEDPELLSKISQAVSTIPGASGIHRATGYSADEISHAFTFSVPASSSALALRRLPLLLREKGQALQGLFFPAKAI